MKAFIFGAISALILISTSHASVYQCANREAQLNFQIDTTQAKKEISVSLERQKVVAEKATLNTHFKAHDAALKGAKAFSFKGNPYSNGGSTAMILSKEVLTGSGTGLAQLRIGASDHEAYKLSCVKVQI